jgi:hypothetical protein
MVRQALDLFGHSVPGERFDGFNDVGMEHAPPLLEQTAVGHFMGKGMLEGVLALRKEPRLVQELRRLQVRQGMVQGVFGQLSNSLE